MTKTKPKYAELQEPDSAIFDALIASTATTENAINEALRFCDESNARISAMEEARH